MLTLIIPCHPVLNLWTGFWIPFICPMSNLFALQTDLLVWQFFLSEPQINYCGQNFFSFVDSSQPPDVTQISVHLVNIYWKNMNVRLWIVMARQLSQSIFKMIGFMTCCRGCNRGCWQPNMVQRRTPGESVTEPWAPRLHAPTWTLL